MGLVQSINDSDKSANLNNPRDVMDWNWKHVVFI